METEKLIAAIKAARKIIDTDDFDDMLHDASKNKLPAIYLLGYMRGFKRGLYNNELLCDFYEWELKHFPSGMETK